MIFFSRALKIDFPAVVVGNTSIPRPAGSTFRVVDEIFLCNKYRQNTEGKQFLFYGFVRDKADVKYCQCIVHEHLTRVTQTAPLVYVAHFPMESLQGNFGANFRSWHRSLRMDAGGPPAWASCLSGTVDRLPKTWDAHHPSTPNIQVMNLQALNPQYPKQCH